MAVRGVWRFAFGVCCLLLAGGCATWRFDAKRSAEFVNEEGVKIVVDYGSERRESECVAPNGIHLKFVGNLKVRVSIPDGPRFVAYQTMSEAGVLYESDDGRWRYFEQGTSCALAERISDERGFALRFEGVLCARRRAADKDGEKGAWRKVRK